MKIGILIPLKSKQVSKNWDITCKSLDATIKSLENQSDKEFDYMVVGHESPDFLVDKTWHGKSVFHSISEIQPPPAVGATQHDYTIDKNSKIVKGIMLLKERNTEVKLWFPLDADDLIHQDLVKIIGQYDDPAGVILEHGYMYYPTNNRIVKTDNFSMYCGSSGMIADRYIQCPHVFTSESIKEVPFCRYPHMNLDKFFTSEINQSYKIPKAFLATYILAHGDNISDGYRESLLTQLKAKCKPYIKGRKPNKVFKREYGIDD